MEDASTIIHFLKKHWYKFFVGVLALACLGVWTERWLKSGENQNKQDFILITQIFDRFQRGESLSPESIESVENILMRHPELHPKYDAMLILTYQTLAKNDQVSHYAQELLKRVDGELHPFYREYAKTTLLITQEKYAEALTHSLTLHNQLQGQKGYETLDGMNTLRVLFLADRLGDETQKALYWKKLQSHPSFPIISSVFQEGKLTLADYTHLK